MSVDKRGERIKLQTGRHIFETKFGSVIIEVGPINYNNPDENHIRIYAKPLDKTCKVEFYGENLWLSKII